VCIVGGGPSVVDHVETIRNWDGDVWCVNGALGWLAGLGITPDVMVMLDAEDAMVDLLETIPEATEYYIASTCSPKVFDRLADRMVSIWHEAANDLSPPSGHYVVPGGSTVLMRSPNLAYMQGWRDVHLFGCDCSYADTTHAYGGTLPQGCIRVRVGQRVFVTEQVYMQTAAWLAWLKDSFPASLTYHGDGLAQALAAADQQDCRALIGEDKPDNAHLVAKETDCDDRPQI
jgi:hypothetical protein